MNELVNHHVSGQLKVAPEHTDPLYFENDGKTFAPILKIIS